MKKIFYHNDRINFILSYMSMCASVCSVFVCSIYIPFILSTMRLMIDIKGPFHMLNDITITRTLECGATSELL